ncbi:asparagine synthase-related protein [Streptomyces uncialis]|uniref:asparagine synthase-related protein n=1 Tax=Streptomyces uncialis TaxID=1048205 RepID=UPI00380D14FA
MGDRAAAVQVHWTAVAGTVAWPTSAVALAALTGAAPDPVRLLAEFTTWGVEPGVDGWFEGIHRVPPGAALTLAPGIPPVIERLPAPAPCSFADAAAVLRRELPLAVGRRAGTGRAVSADLSGGVDSSSVACLAAAHTGLTAITYVDAAMDGQDDSRYAAAVAAAHPALTRHLVDGRHAGSRHFDQLADPAGVPVTDAPARSVAMLGILKAQLAPAVSAGSTGHLTGWGGGNVLPARQRPRPARPPHRLGPGGSRPHRDHRRPGLPGPHVHGSPADLASLHALVAAEVWLTNLPTCFDAWWEPSPAREAAR